MVRHTRSLLASGVVGIVVGVTALAGCQEWMREHPDAATQMAPDAQAASGQTIDAKQLRDVLADLAKSHADRIQLSWGVSTPFKPVAAAFHPMYERMGKENKELLAELNAWAKDHHVDLSPRAPTDINTQAQKMLNEREEKLVRGDNQKDFERDMLMQMYNDYEWDLCQVETLLKAGAGAKDPALQAYLEKSQKVYEAGSGEMLGLLRRYQFD